APYALRLLRARRERPRHHRAAKQGYERAPFHSITSSARASVPGTQQAIRAMPRSMQPVCYSPGFAWTRGLTRRRTRLILLLDDQELQRCVANVSQFMPGNRRNVSVATGTKLDLPRTLFVLQLCLASA